MTNDPPLVLPGRALPTDERAAAVIDILSIDELLQGVAALVDKPAEDWPPSLVEQLRPSPLPDETPRQLLTRWWGLFQDEVALLHDTRNRLAHQVAVSDHELVQARSVARQLRSVTFVG